MSHFAKVINNRVVQVIVAEQDVIDSGIFGDPGFFIQTSYNTRHGVHYDPNTGQPDGGVALRGNYAGIGYVYDAVNDVFYPTKPYPSWVLNTKTWSWEAPVPMPTSNSSNTVVSSAIYVWNEATVSWVEQTNVISNTANTVTP